MTTEVTFEGVCAQHGLDSVLATLKKYAKQGHFSFNILPRSERQPRIKETLRAMHWLSTEHLHEPTQMLFVSDRTFKQAGIRTHEFEAWQSAADAWHTDGWVQTYSLRGEMEQKLKEVSELTARLRGLLQNHTVVTQPMARAVTNAISAAFYFAVQEALHPPEYESFAPVLAQVATLQLDHPIVAVSGRGTYYLLCK